MICSAFTGHLEISYSEENLSMATRLYACYPIKFIQMASAIESCSLIYFLGYGGGLVAGDETSISIILNKNSAACIRTQGSTKVFKSPEGKLSSQFINYKLDEHSLLVLTPDPLTLFESAKFKQKQVFDMHPDASLVLVDWYTSGRTSRNENWLFSELSSLIDIQIGGQRVFFENLQLKNTEYGSIANKMGHVGVYGLIFAYGPRVVELVARMKSLQKRELFKDHIKGRHNNSTIRQDQRTQSHQQSASTSIDEALSLDLANKEPIVAVSNLGSGMTVLRFAASNTESAYEFLALLLKPLHSEIGIYPYQDRLHSTNCCQTITSTNNTSNASTSDDRVRLTTGVISALRELDVLLIAMSQVADR